MLQQVAQRTHESHSRLHSSCPPDRHTHKMFPFVYLCFPVTNERMEKNDVLKPHEVVSFSMAETSWFFFLVPPERKEMQMFSFFFRLSLFVIDLFQLLHYLLCQPPHG